MVLGDLIFRSLWGSGYALIPRWSMYPIIGYLGWDLRPKYGPVAGTEETGKGLEQRPTLKTLEFRVNGLGAPRKRSSCCEVIFVHVICLVALGANPHSECP